MPSFAPSPITLSPSPVQEPLALGKRRFSMTFSDDTAPSSPEVDPLTVSSTSSSPTLFGHSASGSSPPSLPTGTPNAPRHKKTMSYFDDRHHARDAQAYLASRGRRGGRPTLFSPDAYFSLPDPMVN